MAAIKSRNTKPELIVRKIAHSLGYRFRLHRKDISGKPDLVFPRLKKVIFVHGCYWHMHNCKYGSVIPKTNAAFWKNKRESNVARDLRNMQSVEKFGWEPLVVWECQTRQIIQLSKTLSSFLDM